MTTRRQSFVFHDADEYAFLYENAHLLLVSWKRDDTKFLFLIRGQTDNGEVDLGYPGRQFTETVLDKVLPIFFVQVQEGEHQSEVPYVLGSYFVVNQHPYGAYYQKDHPASVVLFKVIGDGDQVTLEVPEDDEYGVAADAFMEQHQDFMDIQLSKQSRDT